VTLDALIDVQRGEFRLAVEIAVAAGEVVAVVGPNGAGKTTLLECLSGSTAIDQGKVTIAGRVVDDPVGDVFVAAADRRVGMVFQDYLLFEHLSALENVAFGLRARGMRKDDARARAAGWLTRVGLGDVGQRRPGALSGGQRQRVALARALITEPDLLLLDEPLAALDAGARHDTRRDLRRHLGEFAGACIVVTHDPLDAYALASRAVVLEGGSVTQNASLNDVVAHPRSRYVADFVGTNLLTGVVVGDAITLANGAVLAVGGSEVAGAAYAVVSPRSVALYRTPPDGSPRNVWQATVTEIDESNHRARVGLSDPIAITAEITSDARSALGLDIGDRIWASVKATEIVTYQA
jgi:molybdate transport system ATP-binding protein